MNCRQSDTEYATEADGEGEDRHARREETNASTSTKHADAAVTWPKMVDSEGTARACPTQETQGVWM